MIDDGEDGGVLVRERLVLRDARALLVTAEGRYLMQLRDDFPHLLVPDHWGVFGGRVEDGESPRQAIVRELQEELRFVPTAVSWFTESAYVLPQLDVPPTQVTFFEVQITEANVASMVLEEGADMRLMSADDLLAEPRIVPWDAYGVLLHARRNEVFRRPRRHG